MQIRLIEYGTEEYWQEFELRDEVLRKPLELRLTKDDVKGEENQYHVGAFEDECLLGCLVLTPEEDGKIRMRQVAVGYDARGKGVGQAMVKFAEDFSLQNGYKKIILNARKFVKGFYENMGYHAYGEEFKSMGIPHVYMEKDL